MATVETIAAVCFPEVPVMFGNEELSKEFKMKFGKLYAKELAYYHKIYNDESHWYMGRESTAVTDGRGAVGWLKWFAEKIQEDGVLVLNRWLELICDHEEEGPSNFWSSSVLLEIALLCLEELGVQDPWSYRHSYFSVWNFDDEEEETCWDKYAFYDALYN